MNFPVSATVAKRERLWLPRRALVTKSALGHAHGRAVAERAAGLGVPVEELKSDRLPLELSDDPRRAYAQAKTTLAVTVAPPSKLKLQPIAPSADWRVDLAEGCPAHCSYCYLAGSLKGAPITRVYANLDEIVANLTPYVGEGTVTSHQAARAEEGTTFEASCYADPLSVEHLTGSLAAMIEHFGRGQTDAQLRFTTKFAAVGPLLGLDHGRRTRVRFSLNPSLMARFEGGTSPVAERLVAMRRLAEAGYRVGLTIAPIILCEGWEEAYRGLLLDVANALDGVEADPDLTVELITHRFTNGSKTVLQGWYPGSALDMTDRSRTEKRTKFGSVKHVYDRPTMKHARDVFEREIASRLPRARILYWT